MVVCFMDTWKETVPSSCFLCLQLFDALEQKSDITLVFDFYENWLSQDAKRISFPFTEEGFKCFLPPYKYHEFQIT